jgi:hypothetical protein
VANPQQLDWRAKQTRSWAGIEAEKKNSLLVCQWSVVKHCRQSRTAARLVNVSLRRKTIDGQAQRVNVEGEIMQAEINLPSNKIKASYSNLFCRK